MATAKTRGGMICETACHYEVNGIHRFRERSKNIGFRESR